MSGALQGWIDLMRQAGEAERATRSRRQLAASQWFDDAVTSPAGRKDSPVRSMREIAPDRAPRIIPVPVAQREVSGFAGKASRSLLEDVPRGKAARSPGADEGREIAVSAGGAGVPGKAAMLAAGYQPAVIKVISYAHGVTRATATAQYVQRDDVKLETHDGRVLEDHEAVSAEMKRWAEGFENRRESADVVTVRMGVAGLTDIPENRELLSRAVEAGFAGHCHAHRIEVDERGAITARVVTVMAGWTSNPDLSGDARKSERFSLREARGEVRFNERYERAIAERIAAATDLAASDVSLRPGKAGHGVDAVAYRLTQIAEAGGAVTDRGGRLGTEAQARSTARAWKPELRSFTPRDTMHMIISAKAGVDLEAFRGAVRGFLHSEFSDHKFAFGIHTDKAEDARHIHAHAIVAVRDEFGQKIHPGPSTFNAWREHYAAQAQAHGIKVVATSAAQRASSQSYGAKDKAIVATADRPRPGREERDRVYARENADLVENARKRIEVARTNPVRFAVTDKQRAIVGASLSDWKSLALQQPQNQTVRETVVRLSTSVEVGATIHKFESAQGNPMAITSEKMRADLRLMNQDMAKMGANFTGDEKVRFLENSGRVLQNFAVLADFQRMKEQGVTHVTPEQVRALAGASADRLIERARDTAKVEQREADAARVFAERADAAVRRDAGNTKLEPASQTQSDTHRQLAREAESTSVRETREAQEARYAAEALASSPTKTIEPNPMENSTRVDRLREEQRRTMEELKRQAEAEAASQKPKGQGQ